MHSRIADALSLFSRSSSLYVSVRILIHKGLSVDATCDARLQGFPPPHGAPIQSVPSGVPQYMATATGSSQGGPPMMPPPLPGMPPAHQGYQHAGQPGYVDQGYGQNAPPAPHEALPAPVGGDQYPDQHYQNQPSY